jgi:hypothetical protein
MGIRGGQPSFEIAASAKQSSPHLCNLTRRTPTSDLHMAFEIPYLYDFVTRICREQAAVILNHENVNFRNIGQGEVQHIKYKRLKLGGGQAYDRSNI